MIRIVVSPSAATRLAEATRFLQSYPPASELLIVGASRGAGDDLARSVAASAGATFGVQRFSFTELAARLAATTSLASPGARRAAGSQAGSEAIAARAVFDAQAAGDLTYFDPVAAMPGFPRALARTVYELRLAGVSTDRLETHGPASRDLAGLLARVERELEAASVSDRAALFRAAAASCASGNSRWRHLPIVLLDVAADSVAEREFLRALVRGAPAVLATVPDSDEQTLAAFAELEAGVEHAADAAPAASDLAHLRRFVFESERPPERTRAGDVRLFSAPGEGREALEIVRRVLDEAAHGVRFDEMAVFLRAPQQYLGLVEHACARADVPVYFDRGTRRPDPAGRAFVALLSCAAEGLSARRFDEYLSLGQVPRVGTSASDAPVVPDDEVFGEFRSDAEELPDTTALFADPPPPDSEDEAIVAGTLRSPWKWEELIVESAIVGGRTRLDGKTRWRRRLAGLDHDYRYRLKTLRREEPESPRIKRIERDLRNLAHLSAFALPVIDRLSEWPERAHWGDWIEHFSDLARTALNRPERVLQVLADLRPMAAVGPVALDEARAVLHDRLVTLDSRPPANRYGRLFVGTPHQSRGRTFRVVFVPGLAERVVPQRPREDPLLLDDRRHDIDAALTDQGARDRAERLLLKLVIGAASERLYLSYPRMDVAETRARVPSFYALDVMRALTGRVPDHRVLAAEAAEEAGASLAWPAPQDADHAIDDLEHDLAVLKPLLDSHEPAKVRGRAHYMLALNAALRRSVISRWARDKPAWSSSDGLIKIAEGTAAAFRSRRLAARPYSLSALQRFATCPYQFVLATMHRLEPREEPEPLVRMDPLTRGSLFHEVQAEFYRALKALGIERVTPALVPEAVTLVGEIITRVAGEYEERLAPAIERVWKDEITDVSRDLGIWVRKLADEDVWIPEYFEFSFGLRDNGRDPRSVPDAVLVDDRFLLHGSVDLIERHAAGDTLRITDHKTGKNRSNRDLIVGGGKVLQPIVYGLVVEQVLRHKVVEGRLFYATTAGGYASHVIPLEGYQRNQALQVLTIVDRAIELGFLPAAPDDGACTWCDFKAVCGTREEDRVARKAPDRLADLAALRSMR